METAIREVKEEIGIEVPYEELKALEPVWVMVSNYWVQPYYAVLKEKQNYVLDKREINRIFEIPVSHFLDVSKLKAHQLTIQNKPYWAPQFEFEGEIIWDSSKPDGTPRKVLDVSKIMNLGWKPSITLDQGISQTVQWYQENK